MQMGRFGAVLLALGMLSTLTGATGATTADAAGVVQLKVLGNRADLVSAGDALVEVVLPAGAQAAGLRVELNGSNVSSRFARRTAGSVAGRVVGLVPGLRTGANTVRATLRDGRGAALTVTGHPRGGPVFSGPQVQKWVCTTDAAGLGAPKDAQCNGNTTYRYHYRPANAALPFQTYDPALPPPAAAIATTTNDQGVTVPYIVRVERGTLNRAIYDVAVLFDPTKPMSPWQPQPGWNRKLLFSFGGGCAPGHSQAAAQDPLLDMGLKRGFAVAVSSLNVMGNACNFHVSAETVMMVKERITEQYGEIRYTIGNGCSGGAEAQNSIAENYPGLLDGIRPECTFADGWTPAITSKSDCTLLFRYFTQTSPALWPSPAARGAVVGNPTDSYCAENSAAGSGVQDWDPTSGCAADSEPWIYDPTTNPTGTRCTLQDYHVAVLGNRGSDGFANGVLDDVGLQWGFKAVKSGSISVEQFVDLNEKVGGWTIDYQPQVSRTQADLAGVRRFYDAGEFTYGRNLASTPTIDARTNNSVDFHGNIQREVVRARQLRSSGNIAAQVYWLQAPPPSEVAFGFITPMVQERTLVLMDDWLSRIERDRAGGSRQAKVIRNKPPEAIEGACVDPVSGEPLADSSPCDLTYVQQELARIVAGGPKTADVLKCQLKPHLRADYTSQGITLTDAQWQRLQVAFPSGVCDWSKPGVGQRAPLGDWITLAGGPPGAPLPAAPVSRAFAAAGVVAVAPAPVASAAPLPATGPQSALVLLGLVCLLGTVVLRRQGLHRGR